MLYALKLQLAVLKLPVVVIVLPCPLYIHVPDKTVDEHQLYSRG